MNDEKKKKLIRVEIETGTKTDDAAPMTNYEIRQVVRTELEFMLRKCGKDPQKQILTPLPIISHM